MVIFPVPSQLYTTVLANGGTAGKSAIVKVSKILSQPFESSTFVS
ncbi:hypothetical protein [Tenacibaculum mesophilum]|nr:hypothetical protein [Tenacibaculum mesophilum]